MTPPRWRLQRMLCITAAAYGILMLLITLSLPQNLDHLLHRYKVFHNTSGIAPLSPALLTSTRSISSPRPSLKTREKSILSTICKMRLFHEDKIPVEDYFKPLPHPVTEVVTTFLIQPHPQLCRGGLDILFLVPSAPSRRGFRDTIRATWGSGLWPDLDHGINMVVLFLLGRPPKETSNNVTTSVQTGAALRTSNDVIMSVEKEAASHGDLLFVDVDDGYRQMTVKMLAGMHWLSQQCQHVRYVARVDEDHFLNVPIFYQLVHTWFQQHHRQRHVAILGKILCSHTSVVHRNGRSKHFVNVSDYPYGYYPTYLTGATYVMTTELIPRLLNVSRYVRAFTVDDAYITGVLVRVLKLLLVNVPDIAMKCSVDHFLKVCGVSKHNAHPSATRAVWQMLRENSTRCRSRRVSSLGTCQQLCKDKGYKWTI